MSDATDHQLSSHPPVTDWTTDFDHAVDEYAARAPEIWDELRSACPVAHSERYGGVWLPTRHEDVAAIAYDTEHFTSRSVVVTEGRPIAPAPRGIAPPKTNWARPIDRPPYYGYSLRTGVTFTYLGLKVDARARCRTDAGPVENLWAAGETMAGSILGQGYLAGYGMAIGTVFGRIAGEEAARHVR